MTIHEKIQRIQTLRYVVASRWFLHAGILVLGLVQKVIGVAAFDIKNFALIFITYSYNFAYFLYLRRPAQKISARGLKIITALQVIVDQLLYTLVLYTSGGIESQSFLFYFLSIFMAIILFNELQIILVTLFTAALYLGVIYIEYIGIIPHMYRYGFDPGFYQNLGVTIHNTATVILILICTAFFAAFISNIIRSREAGIAAERDKITTIIDNLVDGIIMLDDTAKVMLMNPYAQRILHLRSNEYYNRQLVLEDFPPALHDLVNFIQAASNEASYHSREILIDEEDEHIVLQVTSLRVINQRGKSIGVLLILHNITREKDLDRMKSDFISVAAHQLRTPLSTLKWLFKILLDGTTGAMTPKQNDLLEKGYARNNEVIDIVNNLLDVSEIEDGRVPYKFVNNDMVAILQSIVESMHDPAERKDVKLEVDIPKNLPTIKVDRQKFKIAIQNLVDNAIKYSHRHGVVKVAVRLDPENLIITVKDTGIGMAEDTQERLFTKFYRGREASIQDPTGSGLGLYIVKNIIEKHGGTITFESVLGHGTTFIVSIPLG